MNEVLTREKILEAAEVVLRRFGSAKTNVVDVARALGVSHGSVYRHFASKAELRDAVIETWLKRTSEPLAKFVAGRGPALPRLRVVEETHRTGNGRTGWCANTRRPNGASLPTLIRVTPALAAGACVREIRVQGLEFSMRRHVQTRSL